MTARRAEGVKLLEIRRETPVRDHGTARAQWVNDNSRGSSRPRCVAFNASVLPLHVLDTCNPVLRLSDNKISAIEDGVFEDVRGIKGLNLEGNVLTHLSEGYFEGLSEVDILKLSRNRISTIASGTFHHLVSLRVLHLENNQLTAVEGSIFAKSSTIQVLNLTNNNIHAVEADVIKRMQHLRSLILSENKLLHLPIDLLEELAGNEKLKVLEIHDNPYRCTCSVPLVGQSPLLENLSLSIWNQVKQDGICVHPPDLSGTSMFSSTVQFPCPPPLVELRSEKKAFDAKGKWAFTCKVYWEEEPVVTWLLPGNDVLELPYRGNRQSGTLRFQEPKNISWTVQHTVRPKGWPVCYNNARNNTSQSQDNTTCQNFIGRTVSVVVVPENTWPGKEVKCSANLSSSIVVKQSVVVEDTPIVNRTMEPEHATTWEDNHDDYFVILGGGLASSKKSNLKVSILIAASVAMVVSCVVSCALHLRKECQERCNQNRGRDDVSIHEYEDVDNNRQNGARRKMNDQNRHRDDIATHEYEDIDNNRQNGARRKMNDQNRHREDISIHEYEDIDNNHQNGVPRQADDITPQGEVDSCQTEASFYAAAAEVNTYWSADAKKKTGTDSLYNKENKSEESVTYTPQDATDPEL
ncbi:hypothetical protein Bbelb_099230 [Branchiostoma belcheri]|nr:hypothetical protein Bbelb_099230 [Branchiostoma belcheri]